MHAHLMCTTLQPLVRHDHYLCFDMVVLMIFYLNSYILYKRHFLYTWKQSFI